VSRHAGDLLLPHALLLHRAAPLLRRHGCAALVALVVFVLGAALHAVEPVARARVHPFTYNGGFSLYAGNNPRANGGFVRIEATRKLGSVRAASPAGTCTWTDATT
jgi:hypothetical protein